MVFATDFRVVGDGTNSVAEGAIDDAGALAPTAISLRAVVERIHELYRARKYESLIRFLEHNLVAAYYGLQPEMLHEIVDRLLASGIDDRGIVRALAFLVPAQDGRQRTFQPPADPEVRNRMWALLPLGHVIDLRLRGQSHEAMLTLDELDARTTGQARAFPSANGWGLLLPYQSGVTAMLAGDFTRALRYFTTTQMQRFVAKYSFFTRGAYAKSALIHVLFGRAPDARVALDRAATIDRSDSWHEYYIDAVVAMTEALLATGDPENAIDLLNRVPLHFLGEMVPFYVIAIRRTLSAAGRYKELLERVNEIELLPFARVDGEGVAGSVFPLTRAFVNMGRGDIEVATRQLHMADPGYLMTQCARAQLDLVADRPQTAIREAEKLGAAKWRGLHQVAIWRYAALSAAYLQLGQTEHCDQVLRTAIADGLTDDEVMQFSDEVLDHAAGRIEGWPKRDRTRPRVNRTFPDTAARLTSREFEVLRMLREPETSQQQIADRLFVSINTLKTHVKTIYRKLDVTSREAAVLRAEAEGWV